MVVLPKHESLKPLFVCFFSVWEVFHYAINLWFYELDQINFIGNFIHYTSLKCINNFSGFVCLLPNPTTWMGYCGSEPLFASVYFQVVIGTWLLLIIRLFRFKQRIELARMACWWLQLWIQRNLVWTESLVLCRHTSLKRRTKIIHYFED